MAKYGFGTDSIKGMIKTFILAVVLFQTMVALLPTLIGALLNFSGLNLPLLTTLFAANGALTYALSGGITIFVLDMVFDIFSRKGK